MKLRPIPAEEKVQDRWGPDDSRDGVSYGRLAYSVGKLGYVVCISVTLGDALFKSGRYVRIRTFQVR